MRQRFCHVKLMLTIVAILSINNSFAVNRYGSDLLFRMAKSLQIKEVLDSLSEDIYIAFRYYDNHPLTVVVNNGTVEHIGYTIFSKDLRDAMQSPAFDFLERYALEADLPIKSSKSFDRQMFEDGVHFSSGTIHTLKGIYSDSTLDFSMENMQNKMCRAVWHHGKIPFCSVSFPVDYNLFHGVDLVESQRRLVEELYIADVKQSINSEVTKDQLVKIFEPNYYVLQGDSIYIAQLTDNKYFREVGNDKYQLLFSETYPVESFANLLTTNSIENTIQVSIKLVLYDFKSAEIDIPLAQLLTFFKNKGCKAYFGVIDKKDDSMDVELLLTKQDEGYCHIIKLTCDINSLKDRSGYIHGRMNCYIPISKVKSLFGNP